MFIPSLLLHNLLFVNPKIDASGYESKREDAEECDCNCYRLFEVCRERDIVRNEYGLCMSFSEVFEVQSDSRTSNGVEVSYMG